MKDRIWLLPQLMLFMHVVSEGSLSGAARKMGLSRSVVSSHLKKLELGFGAKLLERNTRSLRPTALGNKLFEQVLEIHRAWEHVLDIVDNEGETLGGTLTVTAPFHVSSNLILPAFQRLQKSHPGIHLNLQLSDQPQDFFKNNIDLAVRVGKLRDSSLICKKLGEDKEIIVASPRFLAELPELDYPEQLLEHPWVIHTSLPTDRELFRKNGGQTKLNLRSVVAINSSKELSEFVAAGLGFGMLPARFVEKELQDGILQHVLPDWYGERSDFYAVYPSKEMLPRRVRLFIDELTKEFNRSTKAGKTA